MFSDSASEHLSLVFCCSRLATLEGKHLVYFKMIVLAVSVIILSGILKDISALYVEEGRHDFKEIKVKAEDSKVIA